MKIRVSLVLEEGDTEQSLSFTMPDGQQVTLTQEHGQVDLDASTLADTGPARKAVTGFTKPQGR